MKEMEIFLALSGVRDAFILEASEEKAESVKKGWRVFLGGGENAKGWVVFGQKPFVAEEKQKSAKNVWIAVAALVACVAVVLLVSNMQKGSPFWKKLPGNENQGNLSGNKTVFPGTETAKKPEIVTDFAVDWADMAIDEQYPALEYGGKEYGATGGRCSGETGALLGKVVMVGMERQVVLPEKTDELEEISLIRHETEAEVYEINGVNPEYAVVVKFFNNSEECYVYGNWAYRADSYRQFAQDACLERYLKVNGVAVLDGQGKEKKSYADVEFCEELLAGLFSGKDIPCFFAEDFPAEFLLGKEPEPNSATNTKPYCPPGVSNAADGTEAGREFCKDKEFGKIIASFSVDYTLFAEKNHGISVTDGGFVQTNVGATGKYFYVGKERVEELRERLEKGR